MTTQSLPNSHLSSLVRLLTCTDGGNFGLDGKLSAFIRWWRVSRVWWGPSPRRPVSSAELLNAAKQHRVAGQSGQAECDAAWSTGGRSPPHPACTPRPSLHENLADATEEGAGGLRDGGGVYAVVGVEVAARTGLAEVVD